METIQIRLGDGRVVEVEAGRYNQLDAAFRHGNIGMELATREGVNLSAGDAQEAMAFVVSQLTYTESATYERQYQPLQYEQLIPITNEAGEWAESIRFELYDYVGNGKRSVGLGSDINLVDVAYADVTWPVVNGNIGYKYSTEELRRSAFLRKPVSETKPMAAMDGYRRHMNKVGLYGEASANIFGLFNNPYVPTSNAPNGNWTTTNKANPSLILQDLNTLITTQWQNTAYNDYIDTVAISPNRLAYLASTPRSDNSDKTILQYLLENNVAKTLNGTNLKIVPGFGLDTAGSGGTARMLGYVNRLDRLVMHIPMPLRYLAPQLKGFDVMVPGEYKYSGVVFRYPSSALYVDGI